MFFQSVLTFLKHAVRVQTTYRRIPVKLNFTQGRLFKATVMLLNEFVFCVQELKNSQKLRLTRK